MAIWRPMEGVGQIVSRAHSDRPLHHRGQQTGWPTNFRQSGQPLGTRVGGAPIAIADALARDHQHGCAVVQRASQIGGAVETPRSGVEGHRRQLPSGAVVSCRRPYCQDLMAAIDVERRWLAFGTPARQSLPHGGHSEPGEPIIYSTPCLLRTSIKISPPCMFRSAMWSSPSPWFASCSPVFAAVRHPSRQVAQVT